MNEHPAILVGAGIRGAVWRDAIAVHDSWRLAAIVDIDQEASRRLAEADGIPVPTFERVEDAIDAVPDSAAVVVVTPPEHHGAACRAAIDAGHAVLVEKPFTMSLAEATAIVEAAEKAGVPLLVGQNYRYLRSLKTARALVTNGALGDIGVMTIQYYRPWKDLEPSLRTTPNSILWGMAPHHLDTILFLTSRDIESISARLTTFADDGRPEGATLGATLTLENGALVTYTATYESVGQDRFEGGREFYLRIIGTKATLHVINRWLFLSRPGHWPRPVRRGPRAQTEEAVLLDELSKARFADTSSDVSGRNNLRTMAALEACLRSAETGSAVDPRRLLEGETDG